MKILTKKNLLSLAKFFFTDFIISMKIEKIPRFTINNYYNKSDKTTPDNRPKNETTYAKLPSAKDYLAFTGGYSLNLAKTIERLDILAQKKPDLYPPNIRQWAGMILEEGNKTGETLIDIHKKFYSSLKECFSLEEVKEKFPEFKNVLSENEVEFSKGSIYESFKKGELEFFEQDEDLSLQLLKLYWGEGFSLNDLKKYTNGQDLYYTMRKFKIPTVDRDYGHILKYSDPQYNERLTAEMTQKRLAALDRKAQLEDGEPVYIKRGPLSAEHKQKISESLKKYYQEHTEKILEMSERQKEFYRQNPEKAEELSRVLHKAWNIFGADRIKSALSSFMKGKGFKDFNTNELENPISFSKQKSIILRQFWGLNEWAKKSFSKNMEYAWKKVKEENETFFTVKSSPSQLIRFVEEKTRMKPGSLNIDTVYNPYLKTSSIDKAAQEIVKQNTDIEGINNVMADTYQIAVFNVVGALKDMKMTNVTKQHKKLLDIASAIVKSNMYGKGYKTQYTEEAQQDFIILAAYAAESRCAELVNIVNKALDDAFELALQVHPEVILK